MLPKPKRLNLKRNFKFVASGNKDETSSLKIYYRFGENNYPLVGIALAKKSFSKSHDRNRARRLASAAIETLYTHLISNINLVIMPKRETLDKTSEELEKELLSVKGLYSAN